MRDRQAEGPGVPAPGPSGAITSGGESRADDDTPRPFAVYCIREDGRQRLFNRYASRREAEYFARRLAKAGCRVSIDEPPEHRNDRRRFLVWAVMLGVVKPERMTERVVAEIDREPAP